MGGPGCSCSWMVRSPSTLWTCSTTVGPRTMRHELAPFLPVGAAVEVFGVVLHGLPGEKQPVALRLLDRALQRHRRAALGAPEQWRGLADARLELGLLPGLISICAISRTMLWSSCCVAIIASLAHCSSSPLCRARGRDMDMTSRSAATVGAQPQLGAGAHRCCAGRRDQHHCPPWRCGVTTTAPWTSSAGGCCCGCTRVITAVRRACALPRRQFYEAPEGAAPGSADRQGSDCRGGRSCLSISAPTSGRSRSSSRPAPDATILAIELSART